MGGTAKPITSYSCSELIIFVLYSNSWHLQCHLLKGLPDMHVTLKQAEEMEIRRVGVSPSLSSKKKGDRERGGEVGSKNGNETHVSVLFSTAEDKTHHE